MNNLQKEWAFLHEDIEKYERFSLFIKLFSVLTSLMSVAYSVNGWFAIALVIILWLQDGIWKTFQKRLETRILLVEQRLTVNGDDNDFVFQLYSSWNNQRVSGIGILKEYIVSAIKPTVAYPYVILIPLMIVIFTE